MYTHIHTRMQMTWQSDKTLLKCSSFATRAQGQNHQLLPGRNLNPLKVKKLKTDHMVLKMKAEGRAMQPT